MTFSSEELLRHQDSVDHMGYAVRLIHVGDLNGRATALFVDEH